MAANESRNTADEGNESGFPEMAMRIGPWAGRKYFLDKMSFRDLVVAYATHYAIMSYVGLAVVMTWLAIAQAQSPWPPLLAAGIVIPIYPLVWYLLHRFVLHGSWMYKRPATANLWKRIHFDHHQDPNDLGVLFGALYTTLSTMLIVIAPIGFAIGGVSGAAAGLAMGLFITCFYEFCHCIQHLPFAPRWQWLRDIKRLHLAHHFHSERGNYGITNFFWDRVFGSYYPHPKAFPRSETVFNLGYTDAVAKRYPWVARLTAPRQQERAAEPSVG